MKEYRFGIVGCGSIGAFHALSVQDLPQARLVAVAEPVEERRKEFAEKHHCEGMADFNELAQRGDIDVVCVCTPSGAHRDPGVAAARHGKHVICEKPLEVNLERTDDLIKACDDNGVRLGAIFPSRFNKAAQMLKAAIDEGRFGRLTLGDCYGKWWRSQEYYDSGGWRGTWKLDGGGACMNQSIHGIDLLQWFMGPVDTVIAFCDCLVHERIEVEDTAVAAIRYKNGALGVIECTTSVQPGQDRKIAIHGDKGTAVLTGGNITQWQFVEQRPEDDEIRKKFGPDKGPKSGTASDPMDFSHAGHREQMRDFLDALDKGTAPAVDGREGRKAIEIIIAIYRSAWTGRPVRLPI